MITATTTKITHHHHHHQTSLPPPTLIHHESLPPPRATLATFTTPTAMVTIGGNDSADGINLLEEPPL
ncbi:hypothetical protein Tco_0844169 [Tanacetum coccineum]